MKEEAGVTIPVHPLPAGASLRRVPHLRQKGGEDGLLGRGILRGIRLEQEKDSTVTVQVFGIEYPEFAKLKWQQFLRGFSLAVALLVLIVLFLAIGKQLPSEMPVSVILVLILVILAVFAVYRSNIRREHKRSGLASQRLTYEFDRDGWTVKAEGEQVRVLWSKTWRVRKNQNALLLYPNRRSVNLVPLKYMTQEQLGRIIGWCTGKKK